MTISQCTQAFYQYFLVNVFLLSINANITNRNTQKCLCVRVIKIPSDKAHVKVIQFKPCKAAAN